MNAVDGGGRVLLVGPSSVSKNGVSPIGGSRQALGYLEAVRRISGVRANIAALVLGLAWMTATGRPGFYFDRLRPSDLGDGALAVGLDLTGADGFGVLLLAGAPGGRGLAGGSP